MLQRCACCLRCVLQDQPAEDSPCGTPSADKYEDAFKGFSYIEASFLDSARAAAAAAAAAARVSPPPVLPASGSSPAPPSVRILGFSPSPQGPGAARVV